MVARLDEGAMRSRLSAALIVAAIGAFDARADGSWFGRNYGEWSALSGPSKAAYAAGAFDMLELSRGSAEDLADARGLSSCAVLDGFTPKILAGLIDGRYAAHPEEWGAGAASVLAAALIDACGAQMDAERRQGGLSTLTPRP
jgi:hypothetical protein